MEREHILIVETRVMTQTGRVAVMGWYVILPERNAVMEPAVMETAVMEPAAMVCAAVEYVLISILKSAIKIQYT